VIVSFGDSKTKQLWDGFRVQKFIAFEQVARRKLRQLDIAHSLEDLRIPPGNKLERLQGSWWGFMSIRINQQWRICFRWTKEGPTNVQIVDYH
jgi:proteic killer suppression protein